MPHHVIVGQENNSFGVRQNNQHPVKRVFANRRKLHYIEGIIMLDREFPLHGVQEVIRNIRASSWNSGNCSELLITISQIL